MLDPIPASVTERVTAALGRHEVLSVERGWSVDRYGYLVPSWIAVVRSHDLDELPPVTAVVERD